MARNMYGATSADFTLTSGGRVVPGATLTIWSARTGGTQITDLLDVDSVAATTVTSDADGSIVYYGPNNDKTVHWADSGVGNRIAVRPTDITGDPPVLSIGTVGTGAAAASLTGTSEAPVLNLTLPSAGANGVNTAAIQDGAVTSAKIADGTIVNDDISATAAIDGSKIAGIGNLLTANQASVETDTTGWAANTGTPTIERSTTQAVHGSASLKITSAGSGTAAVALTSNVAYYAAVSPGYTYTAAASLYAETNARTTSLYVTWYTAAGASISNSPITTTTAAKDAWTRVSTTGVAPSTAAYARLFVLFNSTAASDVFYLDAASIHRGADGTFALPGTPVVGQSHIATNGAVHLSGTGSPEGVVTAAPGSTWLQTDATTDVKGWIRWVKATGTGNTGWIAGPEADTGGRNLAAESMSNGWAVYANVFTVRRIGSQVMLGLYLDKNSASGDTTYTLPSGFRPYLRDARAVIITDTADDYAPVSVTVAGAINVAYARMTGRYAYIGMTWMTADTWPSSLPGSAA